MLPAGLDGFGSAGPLLERRACDRTHKECSSTLMGIGLKTGNHFSDRCSRETAI